MNVLKSKGTVFLGGLPGCGKGARSQLLVRDYDFTLFEMSGLLNIFEKGVNPSEYSLDTQNLITRANEAVQGKTKYLPASEYRKKGELVPNPVIFAAIDAKLAMDFARPADTVHVVDGGLRDPIQAEYFIQQLYKRNLPINAAVILDMNIEQSVLSQLGRGLETLATNIEKLSGFNSDSISLAEQYALVPVRLVDVTPDLALARTQKEQRGMDLSIRVFKDAAIPTYNIPTYSDVGRRLFEEVNSDFLSIL